MQILEKYQMKNITCKQVHQLTACQMSICSF